MKFRFICVLLAVLFAAGPSARARERNLNMDVRRFWNAKDVDARKKCREVVLDYHPTTGELAQALARGRTYKTDVETGWQVAWQNCPDGERRPYHVYVPETYDPKTPYPLFFDLHGGVSRPQIIDPAQFESRPRAL